MIYPPKNMDIISISTDNPKKGWVKKEIYIDFDINNYNTV